MERFTAMCKLLVLAGWLIGWAHSAHAQTAPDFPASASTGPQYDWTSLDTTLAIGQVVVLALDEQQTETIARNPSRFNELNGILGAHPSVGHVRGYFAGYALISVGLTYALPHPFRTSFQAAQVTVEAIVIGRNRSIGIKVPF